METFTLICGLPNAGKTTYSNSYKNVIHLDDYHFNNKYEASNADALRMLFSNDVCLEGDYSTVNVRKRVLSSISNIVCKKVCIYLKISKETCLKRENRGREKKLIKYLLNDFEPPTKDEGWDEIIVINNENDEEIRTSV